MCDREASPWHIASIKAYQRYISPHKGFSCAHRLLYGGESCSGYIKGAAQKGLLQALSSARERFLCMYWSKSHPSISAVRRLRIRDRKSKEFTN
ncbi:MAG TPA: hypothetical protein DDW76_23430 [Cyanobacteria bacterium UBA11369]|nr:hypothetical protein [Cyanobacteria bacterium UBA11371]HBE29880.1 hypothetical protein [Cyanobacteria bacterium UBA11368]HBE51645.1 hypothetical protein [Cyanobacteria bacterium UBA11369]